MEGIYLSLTRQLQNSDDISGNFDLELNRIESRQSELHPQRTDGIFSKEWIEYCSVFKDITMPTSSDEKSCFHLMCHCRRASACEVN